MQATNQEFALFLAKKLGFSEEQVSIKPLRKLALRKAQKLIKGRSTITHGGKIIQLSPEKKIDANTFGGTNQFKPVLPTTDFFRVYLAKNANRIPEYLVIDLDSNNEEQYKELIKKIPEAKNTLITRTSTQYKLHVWFKYPPPSQDQINNLDYIIQTRTTKSNLLPGFDTDIFTTGILFEGYLTNRMLNNSKREPKNYTKCIVNDADIQVLSDISILVLKNSIDNSRGKRILERGDTGNYIVYSDPILAATMKKYINAARIVEKYTNENEQNSIEYSDIMYIYNSLFNPAEYSDNNNNNNPFVDGEDDAGLDSKSISLYNYSSKKVVTKKLHQLSKNPNSINSLNMPVPQGNWSYYNNIALKVHSQCNLPFDERQEFIEKWLIQFVLPGSAKKLTIEGWRNMFWDEFSPGDVPYQEPISYNSIVDNPNSLDDYIFGDYSLSGKWLYVPTLYTKYGTSKLRLVQVHIDTEKVKEEGDEIVRRTIEDVVSTLEATAINAKERELKTKITKKQIQNIKHDIDAWKRAILSAPTVQIVHQFKYKYYDTIWWDESKYCAILNTLQVPSTFKIQTYPDDITNSIIHNIIFKQISMTLATQESLYAYTGEKLTLSDGTVVTPALYYCLMLAWTLFNIHAPLGRFIIYSTEGRTGKTTLTSTIPRLIFSESLVFTVNQDSYSGRFTPDYANIRVLSFNEINYNSMPPKDRDKFSDMLKDITEYNGWTRKELKSSNAKDQRVDVLALESTNYQPTITPDDTRVIVTQASKCRDAELIDFVRHGILKLKTSSPEVTEFAQYLRYLYDTNKDNNALLNQALTMHAPKNEQKAILQLHSVNNTSRLHDMILVNGDLNPLDDMRDGSKAVDSIIDFMLDRTPIIYRADIDRVVIHILDLRTLYWLLSKKDNTPFAIDTSKAFIEGSAEYADFGATAPKNNLLKALNAQRFYDIQLQPKDKNNHIIKLYDSITGINEMSKVGDKRKNSQYVMLPPMAQLEYNIKAGYAQHTKLIKSIKEGE